MYKVWKLLIINTGSTSTKVAVYENETAVIKEELKVKAEEVKDCTKVIEQYDMRMKSLKDFFEDKKINPKEFDMIVTRGGPIPPCEGGAYKVNQLMVDVLKYAPLNEHASSLACMLGKEIADRYNIPVMIYDPVSVDEFRPEARLTGFPEIKQPSRVHALNIKQTARLIAKKMGKSVRDLNFVIAHLGGGITIAASKKGRLIDALCSYNGPMTPQRSGRISTLEMMEFCYSGKYSKEEMRKMIVSNAGFVAYFGTQDARDVEKLIDEENEQAKLVFETMAYQVAKGIGEMSVVLDGDVDRIIMTGGMAYSKRFTDYVTKKVSFIAPVEIMPGEQEMEALAQGGLRVLAGEEKAREYSILPEGFLNVEQFYAKFEGEKKSVSKL